MYKVTVEPVSFLYNVGYIVQLSVQQDFIFSRLCREHYSKQVCEDCWEPQVAAEMRWVQAAAVRRVMWMSVITGLVSVVSSQLLGAALDKYSRKVVILVPFMGSLVLSLVCAVVAAVPSLTLNFLYLGAVLNGFTGGFVVFKSSVSSFVVSGVGNEELTRRLAVVEATVFLGSAMGPLALAILNHYITSRHDYLFLSSEGVFVVAILYIIFILPDSTVVPDGKTTSTTISVEVPVSSQRRRVWVPSLVRDFGSAISVTFRKRAAGTRLAIVLLIVADFFIAVVYAAEFDLLYLYMQTKLEFTLDQYSDYLAIKNTVNGVSLLLVLPGLRRAFNLNDITLGFLGGVSRIFAFIVLAFNSSHYWVYVVPFVDIFGQYLFVVLRSIISSLVNHDEQGRALTVMQSMAQVSLLLGSLMFDMVYPVFLAAHRPGLTFLVAASCMTIATTILGYIHWHLNKMNTQGELQPLLQ
ncbi:solute carrier family 46 member 3-like [Homarus americanus]|uniref:solute carrier family 46 member 3-like n=1 Tax=Homarus americanus TaxID=6706 RepID=UPI001C448446|nr:solute carrier family 46 member 3-like [Homarus americanus]XP_042221254.1 solute carrier family 46 member 3-like [Homarus americanus]